MTEQTHDIGPWYKQTWLWFVLTPLIAVVIYGTTFLYLAITTMDGVVKDDYYKVARGTTVDNSKSVNAISLGIKGNILIDAVTGDVRLDLSSYNDLGNSLTVDLVHPTHQKYDQSITVRSTGSEGVYAGSLQSQLTGKRYLIISDTDSTWSIRREILPPYDQNTFTVDPNAL